MEKAEIELLEELLAVAEREAMNFCKNEGWIYNGLVINDDGFLAVSYITRQRKNMIRFKENLRR